MRARATPASRATRGVLDVGGRRRRRARARRGATRRVDLVVVGPEVPLVAGLVDALQARGDPRVRAERATPRGSRARRRSPRRSWSPPACRPPRYAAVTTVEEGMAAIERYPVVLKSDGLAAGKGVVIAEDEATARATLDEFLVEGRFGDEQVVVEEHLVGEELSLLALCDGERAIPMAPAQDYKRIFDGDEGPNTGGMGAYSPVPGRRRRRASSRDVHQPVVDLLRERGHAVPRRPLRRAHAHRRRAEGARVQRPLRRPRDAGGAAAAALGPRRRCSSARRAGRPGGRRRSSGPTTGR